MSDRMGTPRDMHRDMLPAYRTLRTASLTGYRRGARVIGQAALKFYKTGSVPINVTLRRVRATIVVQEKQQVVHIAGVCL